VTQDRLLERLRRLEQQIRAFKELHANELQIILDELSDIASEVASAEGPTAQQADSASDPAAASPKRAKWLAEEERKQRPMSRRELLRGRDEES